jgi:hypothetical protein
MRVDASCGGLKIVLVRLRGSHYARKVLKGSKIACAICARTVGRAVTTGYWVVRWGREKVQIDVPAIRTGQV